MKKVEWEEKTNKGIEMRKGKKKRKKGDGQKIIIFYITIWYATLK
jgi:hypothetical protein